MFVLQIVFDGNETGKVEEEKTEPERSCNVVNIKSQQLLSQTSPFGSTFFKREKKSAPRCFLNQSGKQVIDVHFTK